jgi:hypothetical protein
LWDVDHFLRRVREHVVPGVQQVRDALIERYPEARRFIKETYPQELQAAAEAEEGSTP